MKDFFLLNQRTNINSYHIQATCGILKDVILYDDHRTLLNILFEIQQNKWIDSIPNLIYFDQHDETVVPRGLSISDCLAILGIVTLQILIPKNFGVIQNLALVLLMMIGLRLFPISILSTMPVCVSVRKDANVRYTMNDKRIKNPAPASL